MNQQKHRLAVLFLIILLAASALSACGRPFAASSSEQSLSAAPPAQSLPESAPLPGDASSPSASSDPLQSSAPVVLTLAVPEGYTLARIGMTLEEKGVCTAAEFIAAAQSGDFSTFPLIAAQEANPNRCFALEGYLFPATYEIYDNETPDSIIRRMLTHTEDSVTADLRAEAAAIGLTMDQVITLASIIEKESFGHGEMRNVSSVLHNRLNQGTRLQCDVTINYVEGAIKPFITGDVNRYNSYYNTYKCPALPAGAICNPSLDAIKAALRPADTDYLFFVTDKNQNYYYASTWEQHEKNVSDAKNAG